MNLRITHRMLWILAFCSIMCAGVSACTNASYQDGKVAQTPNSEITNTPTISPTLETRDVSEMAPPYEEIRTTIDTIYTGERALSEDEKKKLEVYVQGLLGKRVDWQGWLAQINPDEVVGEDFNRDDYQGNYSAYVLMEDPNTVAVPPTLLVLGIPRSQLERFRLWNEPNQDPRSRQKIRIHGIISHIDTSTFDFLVTAITVLPGD